MSRINTPAPRASRGIIVMATSIYGGLPTWTYVPLALTALMYRLCWPLVEKPISDCSSQFPTSPAAELCDVLSLVTKFVFVFSALSCAMGFLPAMMRNPTFAPRDRRAGLEQMRYYTAAPICLLVTSINCKVGWILTMEVIREYFTRGGFGFDDLSLFDQAAMIVSQAGYSVMLLGGLFYTWVRVIKSWHMARKALVLGEINEREIGTMKTKVADTDKPLAGITA